MIWIAIGTGGALGAMARHGITLLLIRLGAPAVPYATAAVNITGCLLAGVLVGLASSGRVTLTPSLRAFLIVGLLGGFTTFSSFGLDTMALAQRVPRTLAFWNVAGQVSAGLAAVAAGYLAATRL